MLREFQEEIARLKAQLDRAGGGGGRRGGGGGEGGEGGVEVREKVVDVVQEKIKYVERPVEVEKVVEVEKLVEVEKEVEVEKVVEREVEVEKIVEVVHEVAVEKIVEVEKLVGMREEDVEALKRSIQDEGENERRRILADQERTVAEVERHQSALEAEEERMRSEAEERERIRQELEGLEAKIMHGGEHVRERVARREAEIAEQERLLEERRLEEVRLRQRAAEEEEKKLAQEEAYNTLQEEAESKSRKLKQLWSKFKAAQAEIDDLQIEQQQEKQDLLHTVRELTRQVQLQNLVIESFVPPEEVAKLEKRAVWDDDGSEQWRLLPLSEARGPDAEARPKSHPSLPRPTSFLARSIAGDLTNNEPRYRSLNILSFDLDMPERTTADYEADVNPNVRAALTAALKDDEEVNVDAEENLPTMGGTGWTPSGDPNASANRAAALGMSAALAGSKLKANATKKKPKPKKRDEDDDIDALLLGGSAKAPVAAEEAFPESRGLGSRRGLGVRR